MTLPFSLLFLPSNLRTPHDYPRPRNPDMPPGAESGESVDTATAPTLFFFLFVVLMLDQGQTRREIIRAELQGFMLGKVVMQPNSEPYVERDYLV